MTPSPTNATFAIISSLLQHDPETDRPPQKSNVRALLMARPVAARQHRLARLTVALAGLFRGRVLPVTRYEHFERRHSCSARSYCRPGGRVAAVDRQAFGHRCRRR